MKRLLLIAFLFAAPAYATNFYTSSTGTDSGSCTIGSPCNLGNGLGYELALLTAANSDIIWMCAAACDAAGSATIDWTSGQNIIGSNTASGTTWSNAARLQPYTGETITVQPATRSNPGILGLGIGLSYFIIDGCPGSPDLACAPRFILDGINITDPDGGLVLLNGGDHLRFRGTEVKNGDWIGVGTSQNNGWGSYYEIVSNKIHDNGRGTLSGNPDHCIYMSGNGSVGIGTDTHHIVAYNELYNCTHFSNSFGIVLYTGENDTLQGVTIHSNYIHDNGYGIACATGGNNCLVYDNVVANTTNGKGIAFSSSGGNKAYNNTVYGSSMWYGISIDSGTGNEAKNNICYGNAPDTINDDGTSSVISNNLCDGTNPLFAGAPTDFHLLPTSPALPPCGTNIAAVTVDKDGITRPNPPSCGAYEVPSGVDPGSEVLEDFESYTASANINGLNGGTGWTQTWQVLSGTATVETSSCLSGKEFRSGSASSDVSVRRLFTAKSGEFTIQAKLCVGTTTPDGQMGISLTDAGGGYHIYVYFDDSGDISYFGESGAVLKAGYAINTSYTVRFNFDTVNQPNQVRMSVNDDPYTAWVNAHNSFTSIGGILIDDFASNASLSLDAINDEAGPPQLPPAAVTPVGIRARMRGRI